MCLLRSSCKKLQFNLGIFNLSSQPSTPLHSDLAAESAPRKEKKCIPYAKPHITEDDCNAVLKVLNSTQITRGNVTRALENKITELCDVPYAIAFSSGSSALWCSVVALECDRTSKAYVPANTFNATASCALAQQLDIQLLDVSAQTGMLPLETLKDIIPLSHCSKENYPTTASKQILLPVHYGGSIFDMPSLSAYLNIPDMYIIEDAAQALGASYANGEPVGCCRYSDLTVFSLHAIKSFAAGEGGIVTTRCKDLFERLLKLRNSGLDLQQTEHLTSEQKLTPANVAVLSCNFHLTEMQAALALSQLDRIEEKRQKRIQLYSTYREAFYKRSSSTMLPLVENSLPCIAPIALTPAVICNETKFLDNIQRKKRKIQSLLLKDGISTAVHYTPLYRHSLYQDKLPQLGNNPKLNEIFPGTELFYHRTLSLPFFDELSKEMVHRIVESFVRAEKKSGTNR